MNASVVLKLHHQAATTRSRSYVCTCWTIDSRASVLKWECTKYQGPQIGSRQSGASYKDAHTKDPKLPCTSPSPYGPYNTRFLGLKTLSKRVLGPLKPHYRGTWVFSVLETNTEHDTTLPGMPPITLSMYVAV